MRSITTDESLRMNTAALAAAVERDRAAGLRPLMLAATAGTTDTGSVDPLMACAEIARTNDLWFHVDAAYGGFFHLTDRGRSVLAGIERADSITVDAHKSLFIPYGVGGLLVADGRALVDAHEDRGNYMQDGRGDPDVPDFFARGAELSRPYRGLDLWLPLQLHGVGAFRAELDRMLDLAQRSAARLQAMPGIELSAEPTLSIVAFRCASGDADTAAVLAAVNRSAEVHLSSTTIDDHLTIRLAFLNHRSTEAIADRAVDLVAESLAGLGTTNPSSITA